jgi:hypothetical protein
MKTKNKKQWEEWFDKIEARGYKIYKVGKCPECGGKACVIHNDGVVHSHCENDDYHDSGFGGPNVRSWSSAVAFGNMSEQDREEEMKQKTEFERKQLEMKSWLVN